MNTFILEAKKLVYQHGVDVSYVKVTEGVYDVNTSSITNTESTSTIKAFPKKLKISSYSYPDLVGKVATEFIIVSQDLASDPDTQDKIIFNQETLTVYSFTTHYAEQQKVIYKVIAVKG